MTATLVYERLDHDYSCAFPYEQMQSTYGKSYYKLYQLKIRQLLTENQSRQEHEGKSVKSKQSMNQFREKIKPQTQNDEHNKRASSVLSVSKRRTRESVVYSVASSDISTKTPVSPTESRPKSIVKNKQSSSSTKQHQRVISAPATSQRNSRKKTAVKIPTIEIDDTTEENLLKSNGRSYTRITSSSQNHMEEHNQYARQSVLNAIMLHLHLNTPADLSKWNLYRSFDEKISTSVAPRVYRSFERIIL